MPQNLKGHLALISLWLLAAASPFDGAAATQEGTSLVSPLARRLQLAPPQQLALDTLKLGTAPKIEKLDIPKQDLPKQPGPSSQTSKPPAKLDNADKASISSNANVVVFNDPKFGELKITPGAKAAYLQLPESVRAKLTDPQGGKAVSETALRALVQRVKLGRGEQKSLANTLGNGLGVRGTDATNAAAVHRLAVQNCVNNGNTWATDAYGNEGCVGSLGIW
jgi:hypothetical protein